MKTRIILLIFLGFWFPQTFYAQCNSKLVDVAIAEMGKDALFVREFKAKLSEGSVQKPVPVARFNAFLQEKSTYRFNVTRSQEATGEAVLQLFSKNELEGTTLGQNNRFEYTAEHTGNYEVVIFFKDGKAGCAAGIMSLIQKSTPDSINLVTKNEEELETVYIGIENQLDIATDKADTDTVLLSTDNGKIVSKPNGLYILEVTTEGLATITATVKTREGKTKETATKDFLVRRLPIPAANIQGLRGGIISRSLLQLTNTLEIDQPIDFEKMGYQIVDFHVKIDKRPEKQFTNTGKKFNPNLKILIAGLLEDSKLVIDEIHVSTPQKQILTLEAIGFIIK